MEQVLVVSQNISAIAAPAVQPWRSFHMPRLPPSFGLYFPSRRITDTRHLHVKQRYTRLLVQRAQNASTSRSSQSSAAQTDSQSQNEKWESFLSLATSLYPVYVTIGGILAISNPSAFSWFVSRGPTSYSLSLGTIMLAMGLSLRLEDLLDVITKRSFPLIFGCAAQYTLMPLLGAAISKILDLPSALSAGLILLGCCPGGTASNVVTYIARGDVPLSVVMTSCTTLSAVFVTPLLTQYLAGTYVPVDAVGLALSTLQLCSVSNCWSAGIPASRHINRSWDAEFILGCGFGFFPLQLSTRGCASCTLSCAHEHYGKWLRCHLETFWFHHN